MLMGSRKQWTCDGNRSGRNYWHLYNWLKQAYMWTGGIPTVDAARREFPELSAEEMSEGFAEFMLMINKHGLGA